MRSGTLSITDHGVLRTASWDSPISRNILNILRSSVLRHPAALLVLSLTFHGTASAGKVEFPSQTKSVEVPFELASEHIRLDVEIDGKGPFKLLFDTGAVNVLTPDAAQRLGLEIKGKVTAKGTGGVQTAGETRVESVQIGGVVVRDQKFYVVALPSSAVSGEEIDGLIGHGWLSTVPTRIDYASAKITFHKPEGYRYAGPASGLPLRLRGTRPQVDASVDGIPGKFTVDTGSSGSLILFPGFAANNALLARYQPKTRIMSAVGVGGPVYAWVTRAGRLKVGDAEIDRPLTYLSLATAGAATDDKTAGSLGFGVLRRFSITFDYPDEKIYFEPNAAIDSQDPVDRSGLRVESAAGGFKVVFVAEGSPGARAGLKAGDMIEAVDGRPAVGLGLQSLRVLLKGPIGAQVALMVSGNGVPLTIELADP